MDRRHVTGQGVKVIVEQDRTTGVTLEEAVTDREGVRRTRMCGDAGRGRTIQL